MYLSVKKISKKYKKEKAVSDISFDLEKGKLLCLLGPSGCGKTTILKAIGGFIKPDAGEIILDEAKITHLPPEKRAVSTVFQSYGLFPHMNVLSNIIYGLKFKNISKSEQVEMGLAMIKKIGLGSYEKKKIYELSGGEQQRVAIARSLIIKPKLLLLDEPLSNLDAKLRVSMRNKIRKLQKEFNITTIFVTHDQNEAFEIADKIILMNKGELVQADSPENLYNKPNNIFSLNFIGASNQIYNSYIRPERISVYKEKPLNSNFQKAIIKRIIFKGSLLDLYLEADEQHLKAAVLNNGTEYKTGDNVFISYNKQSIY